MISTDYIMFSHSTDAIVLTTSYALSLTALAENEAVKLIPRSHMSTTNRLYELHTSNMRQYYQDEQD